ncbi:MAG: RNA polymerase sigma-70 factor [Bacteroidales bacterium]|nr:RNA polymerase sigma-70 factor [Bacteroidales bacterium]MDY6001200.1 RNA polymerase sigma-70 factor [Candidatus Cryptobacteroides sp.]
MNKEFDSQFKLDVKSDFDRIYVSYYSRMRRFAQSYVISAADAENIVQDVFVKLWSGHSIITLRTCVDNYLFSLVKNRCLDFLRHKLVVDSSRKDLAMNLESLEYIDEQISEDIDLEKVLVEAIDRLPERCRKIFLKSRLEGKKYKEIAEELGLSSNTIENQMSIALKKLREDLRKFLPAILFFIV